MSKTVDNATHDLKKGAFIIFIIFNILVNSYSVQEQGFEAILISVLFYGFVINLPGILWGFVNSSEFMHCFIKVNFVVQSLFFVLSLILILALIMGM